MSYSLREIVTSLGGELLGSNETITGTASLLNAKPGHISFIADTKYRGLLESTKATAVIVSTDYRDITSLPRIVTANPYAYFARVAQLLNPISAPSPGVHSSAVIQEDADVPVTAYIAAQAVIGRHVKLGNNVSIGPGCVVGDHVSIGDNTILGANVVVHERCVIGNNCNLFAGCIIGADGFGYAEENGSWVKIPQIGRVVINNNVDVGANTTIDRGALDDTIIEDGVKIDNLVQIGHNCRIGAHTVIAGCVGIAGSARIGEHCRIGGAAMILGHLDVADNVTVSPGSMITRSLHKPDTYTALMPFQSHEEWLKTAATLRHIDRLAAHVKELEKELASVKARLTERNDKHN